MCLHPMLITVPPMSEPIRISGSSEVAAESGGEAVSGSSSSDVFIKSFVFQPELPIRIDYEGKRFQMEAVVCVYMCNIYYYALCRDQL